VKLFRRAGTRAFWNTFWIENPIFRMILGICSSLATTNRLSTTLAMGLAVTFSLAGTGFVLSLMRKMIPTRLRMGTYMVTISVFVIVVDRFLKAYYFPLSEIMGPYVSLIITNCILMGRAEAYAAKNPPLLSALDGIGAGLGYAFSLLAIALVREPLGFGTLFGFPLSTIADHLFSSVPPLGALASSLSRSGEGWENWIIMVGPPGAFFVLGTYMWIMRSLGKSDDDVEEA
jgi:Na+-transporting NADH:ubiquinone oxidoreductase subunit D